jgi:hypothetical protein
MGPTTGPVEAFMSHTQSTVLHRGCLTLLGMLAKELAATTPLADARGSEST